MNIRELKLELDLLEEKRLGELSLEDFQKETERQIRMDRLVDNHYEELSTKKKKEEKPKCEINGMWYVVPIVSHLLMGYGMAKLLVGGVSEVSKGIVRTIKE